MRTIWFQRLHVVFVAVAVAVGLWAVGQALADDYEPPIEPVSSGAGVVQFGSVVVSTPQLWGPGIDARVAVEPQMTTGMIVN